MTWLFTLFAMAMLFFLFLLLGIVWLLRSIGRGGELNDKEREVIESISRNLDKMEQRLGNVETIVGGSSFREKRPREGKE